MPVGNKFHTLVLAVKFKPKPVWPSKAFLPTIPAPFYFSRQCGTHKLSTQGTMSLSGFRLGARLCARATHSPTPVCRIPRGAQGRHTYSQLAGGAQRRPGSGSGAASDHHGRPLSGSSGVMGQRSASNHRPQQQQHDAAWALSVSLPSGEEGCLSKLWLRDSCRCSSCVDPSSGQKNFETCDIPASLAVDAQSVRPDGSLEVRWANDFLSSGAAHHSVYPASLVARAAAAAASGTPSVTMAGGPCVSRTAWDRKSFEAQARFIPYADWVKGGDEFWRGFAELARLGLVFIRGVPESEAAVEEIARPIGHLQTTFYGKTWDVVSKPQAENVAYTNVFLGLHQDLLYMKDPPRLQLLHCLANSCEGGESLFSDGIRAAEAVRADDPAQFALLRDAHVRYHYDKNGYWYEWSRPVVTLATDGSGAVDSIGWSPPFQDHFLPPRMPAEGDPAGDSLEDWRAAARRFRDAACAPDAMFEYKMEPGECVIFDNMRVLHGRRQFNVTSGKRWLKGTYVQEQVMLSKLAQMPTALKTG
ncbi:hypothetical protein RB595_007525 [Gaeumannomyces hyphopodioides]